MEWKGLNPHDKSSPPQAIRGSSSNPLHRRLRAAQKIVLATGAVYEIEDSREAAPGKAHTTGELARRYVVKINGKETFLYRDGERWFVEMIAK